jgi:hypothetical protein
MSSIGMNDFEVLFMFAREQLQQVVSGMGTMLQVLKVRRETVSGHVWPQIFKSKMEFFCYIVTLIADVVKSLSWN